MDIEEIKANFLNNKRLSNDELILIFEDILDHVINVAKFENTANSYYTRKNFNLAKIMLLESFIEYPYFLDAKIEKVMIIERNELRKDFKIWRNLGVFFCFFAVVIYFFTERSTPFFAISLIALGIIFIWRGIDGLGRLKAI